MALVMDAFPLPEHGMPEAELLAWTAGFIAGWANSDAAAELDGRPTPARRFSVADLERAGRRRLWDLAVIAGEIPDPDEIERRLWTSPKSSS